MAETVMFKLSSFRSWFIVLFNGDFCSKSPLEDLLITVAMYIEANFRFSLISLPVSQTTMPKKKGKEVREEKELTFHYEWNNNHYTSYFLEI